MTRSQPPTPGSSATGEVVELSFPSRPGYLCILRGAVSGFCQKAELERETADQVTLAIVEAVTNIIRHAYAGDPKQRVTLRCRETGQGIEIELLDRGRQIPPERFPTKPMKGSVRPGGLGVYIIRKVMDEVEYQMLPDGGNRLVLRKDCGKAKSAHRRSGSSRGGEPCQK